MITRRGVGLGIASVASYIVAALLHYPELGVLSASGALALAAGALWVVRKPNLAITRTVEPSHVTRGEVSLALLRVKNQGRLVISSAIAEDTCGDANVGVAIPRLVPGATTSETYQLPTTRRAVLQIGPLTVVRQDPFSLWRTSQRLGATASLWVRPRVHPLGALPSGVTRSLDGPDRDGLPHGSIAFHALREYVPGDDLRHIHWRSSARLNTLMVKDHVDTSLPRVMLVLDTAVSSHSPEAFEEAVEVAASLATCISEARLGLRLITTDGKACNLRGLPADAQEVLDLLAGVSLVGERTLALTASRLAAERRGDILLVVTGTPSSDDVLATGGLASRFSRGTIVLVSPDAGTVDIATPSHVRVLRVGRAAEFASQWQQIAVR